MGISNYFLGCINTIILFLSLPILALGYLLRVYADSPCDPIFFKPLLALGSALLAVSLLGLFGSCCRHRCRLILVLYALLLGFLVVGLFSATAMGATMFKLDKAADSDAVPVVGGADRLRGTSRWLARWLVEEEHWEDVKKCLVTHDACTRVDQFRSIVDFVSTVARGASYKLTPMETGCCRPPEICGFKYVNATHWIAPVNVPKPEDPDCEKWSNEHDKLCYNCETCKAGYLTMFVRLWKKLYFINVLLLLFLLLVFVLACCALIG